MTDVVLARRSVGTGALWLMAVSASAPMTVLVGGVVTTFASVQTINGVPGSFLVLGVALALLATGAGAVAVHIAHPAPMYAVMAHGAGKAWGVAGGFVALLGYHTIQISLYGLIGATLNGVLGFLPWWIWAYVVWLGVGLCGLLRVDIGVGLIGTLLTIELLVMLAFIVAALTHPAPGGFTLEPLQPDFLFIPGAGGVLAFGIAAFIGFESGLAYGEEARSHRAAGWIPLITLAFLAPFYALASWALIVATGPGNAVNEATANDPNLPFTLMSQWGPYGQFVALAGTALLVTSVLAAMLSFHSTAARHLFAMGRERVLPTALATTGRGHSARRDAPVGGSLAQSLVAAVVIGGFALVGADPVGQMFTWLSSIAALSIMAVLLGASYAALRWFSRGGGQAENLFVRRVAPTLGMFAGVVVLGIMTYNLGALLGVASNSPLRFIIPAVVALAAILGFVRAAWLRMRRPEVYDQIGRGRPTLFEVPDQRLSAVQL